MADDTKPAAPAATPVKAAEPKFTVALKLKTKELFEFGPSGWKSTKDAHVEVLPASPKKVTFFKDWTEASAKGLKK